MKRRARTGGKKNKGRRRKTPTPKRRAAPAVARPRRSSNVDLQEQLDHSRRELKEAREQLTAASQVLKIISSSPGDLQPVFQAMLQSATQVCDASYGTLYLCEAGGFRTAAVYNVSAAYAEVRRSEGLLRPPPDTPLGSVARTKQVAHITDLRRVQSYIDRHPFIVTAVELGGYRTAVCVPMLKNNELIGAITISRKEVKPFTDKQIALVQNFAAQAVIAIENTRLLNELRQRTGDLSEALEQQTATSEVLKVISSSPGELKPVFDAMLANATRVCGAEFGALTVAEGDGFRNVARYNLPPEFAEWLPAKRFRPHPQSVVGEIARTKALVHIDDLRERPSYREGDPVAVEFANLSGARTILSVPMLKEGELIGSLAIFRREVRRFTDKQVELLQNFASQAVIAIENTRLLNELRESLQQQTATSEVLQVISSSPGELEPVFHAMLENAVRICGAKFGSMFRYENGEFYPVARLNLPPALDEFMRHRGPRAPNPGTVLEEMWKSKRVLHTLDDAASPSQSPPALLGGARTHLAVPMLKDDELVGAITIYRQEVRPFEDKQIQLVQNFAAQAVIAIENTRLLNELRQRTDDLSEALEQQTATSEVLQVISSSPGELEPVFQTMLENAVRICEAKFGQMFLCVDDHNVRVAAQLGVPAALTEFDKQRGTFPPAPGGPIDTAIRSQRAVHVTDMPNDRVVTPAATLGGARSYLAVPMLKENQPIGVIAIYRQEVRPFADKQIDLMSNFAAQAVIAIENARLLHELRESLQQQTATADVLKVISRSTFDLKIVLNTLVESAARLCNAYDAVLLLREKDSLTFGAHHGPIPMDFDKWPITKAWTAGRAVADRKPIHVHDLAAASDEFPEGHAMALRLGHRTILSVPLLREDEAIGCLSIRRTEVRPFTDKQVELARTFADQAVIAIENVRLFDDVQKRTAELAESLEQQTATSEVLKVISSSPGELKPVFEAMLENATRICEAKFGNLFLYENNTFRVAVQLNAPLAYAERWRRQPILAIDRNPRNPLARLARTKSVVNIPDLMAEPGYIERDPRFISLVEAAGARTHLLVPMLKEGELVGAIAIYRQEVQPFTEKQIELVKNFAAQAVIAIENARLLSELRQRTDDLTESLEQQTATSEVLRVISRSGGDLQPVFEAMLSNATRICDAKFGNLLLYEGDTFRRVALHNAPEAWAAATAVDPHVYRSDTTIPYRVADTKQTLHIADLAIESGAEKITTLAGARTLLLVPMLKENQLVGLIGIYRQEVRPFTDKQIELLQSFAAQAVIAIENARLLNELRESLQQQTATSDVLKVISRSTFDLKTVLRTLVESATRLCEADMGIISRPIEGGFYRIDASYGLPDALVEAMSRSMLKIGKGSVTGRTGLTRAPVHILDAQTDPDYELQDALKVGDWHSMIGVPLLREGNLVGVFGLSRKTVRAFTEKQIELVTTFADQAVIAIENVRLFDEIQDKSRQLAEASQHKSQFLANMSHELRTPLNAILGYTELIADGVYGAPPEKVTAVLKRVESNGKHLLGLINAVLDLSKIEAGQLTLDLADYSLGDVTQTVCSAVEALAIDKKLAFKAEVAADLPRGRGDERRLAQVLLNLVGNAIKFTDAGEVVITAAASNGSFNVSVRDTGPGISAADQAKLFQEFQQADNSLTRKKGGTGLGLAISKRIIEMHGGRIRVESEVGRGSTFFVTLPVHA